MNELYVLAIVIVGVIVYELIGLEVYCAMSGSYESFYQWYKDAPSWKFQAAVYWFWPVIIVLILWQRHKTDKETLK